jgi:hypothetical protein
MSAAVAVHVTSAMAAALWECGIVSVARLVGKEREGRGLTTYPWPHLLLDSFLPEAELAAGLEEIAADEYEFGTEPRGTGRIEFSLLKSKVLWRAIYTRRIVDLLSEAFGARVRLNKHNMLQLRRMTDETPEFPLHSDYTSNEDTIASFLYLSSGWSVACGGRLRLYEANDVSAPSVAIEPLRNRFIAFQTKPAHWHSVERVRHWDRFSVLALWDIDGGVQA